MQKRQILILATVLLAGAVSFSAMKFLSSFAETPAKKTKAEHIPKVQVDTVRYKKESPDFSAQGRLAPAEQIYLTAEAAGKIVTGAIPLKEGATFKKGDLIFSIYKDEAELQLKATKSKFMKTVASILPDLKIDYPAYHSGIELFFERLSPEASLPKLPVAESQKLKIFLANRGVLSEYYTIKQQELALSRHSFIAPFSGTIESLQLQEGSFAGIGSRIGTIINTDFLELEVPVDPMRASFIDIGTAITVRNGKKEFPATIARKSAFIDRQTQTQTVYIKVPNASKNKLYSGQYLSALFRGFYIDAAVKIPRNALVEGEYVFLVKEGRLQREKIGVLSLTGEMAFIEGLTEGDILVVEPLVNAKDNSKVTVWHQ